MWDAHISSVIKATCSHLRNIAKLRPTLSDKAEIHAFVIPRLDYCNALFARLPDSKLHRLQLVQNNCVICTTDALESGMIYKTLLYKTNDNLTVQAGTKVP